MKSLFSITAVLFLLSQSSFADDIAKQNLDISKGREFYLKKDFDRVVMPTVNACELLATNTDLEFRTLVPGKNIKLICDGTVMAELEYVTAGSGEARAKAMSYLKGDLISYGLQPDPANGYSFLKIPACEK